MFLRRIQREDGGHTSAFGDGPGSIFTMGRSTAVASDEVEDAGESAPWSDEEEDAEEESDDVCFCVCILFQSLTRLIHFFQDVEFILEPPTRSLDFRYAVSQNYFNRNRGSLNDMQESKGWS